MFCSEICDVAPLNGEQEAKQIMLPQNRAIIFYIGGSILEQIVMVDLRIFFCVLPRFY